MSASESNQFFQIDWCTRLLSSVTARPTVIDKWIYVSLLSGEIACLDLDSGRVQWKWPFYTRLYASSVEVSGPLGYFSSADGFVACFELESCVLKWRFKAQAAVSSSPLITAESVIFGDELGNLFCVDRDTGSLRWRIAVHGPISTTPIVFEKTIVFGCDDYHVYCVSAEDGGLVWRASGSFWITGAPIVAGDNIVFSPGHYMEMVKATTGDTVWQWLGAVGEIDSPARVFRDRILIGDQRGFVCCLDLLSGTLIWHFSAGDSIVNPILVEQGTAYFGSYDDCLYGVDVLSGSLRGKWTDLGASASEIVAVADGLVFACDDGRVFRVSVPENTAVAPTHLGQ